jgi:hypothetical protein
MSSYTALFDASVLYPATVRDILLQLAVTDLFRAKWTADIHEEWIRSLLRDRPQFKRADLERTRTLMDTGVRDCLVTGYQPLIPSLSLPDPDDRHVLAAAIVGRCDDEFVPGNGTTVHVHINAIDSKSFERTVKDHARTIKKHIDNESSHQAKINSKGLA